MSETRIHLLLEELLGSLESTQSLHPFADGATNLTVGVTRRRGDPLVLRVYSAGARALQKERALLDHLVATDLPTPRVIATTLTPEPAALLTWLPGTPAHRVQAHWETLGELLGSTLVSVHGALAYDAHGLLDEELNLKRTFPSLRTSLEDFFHFCTTRGGAATALSAPALKRLKAYVASELPRVDAIEARNGLVHGDFKCSNLLLGPDGTTLTGILDWEFALAGPPHLDAARLLRHSERRPGFSQGFARGFLAAGGLLPDGWPELLKLLDLRHLLGSLNCSSHRTAAIAEATDLIEATVTLQGR